jgi:hypothetical protein
MRLAGAFRSRRVISHPASGRRRFKSPLLVSSSRQGMPRTHISRRSLCLGYGRAGAKNAVFAPLYTKNDQFTKTGSGQLSEKLRKRSAFLQRACQRDSRRQDLVAQSRERNQALGHPRLHTLRCTRLHPGCVAERTGERPRCDPGAEKTTLLICLRSCF